MRTLVELLAPLRCVGCGRGAGAELCADCAQRVTVLYPPLCARCGVPQPVAVPACGGCRDLAGFRRARSVVSFVEPARGLTLALKRRGRPGLARDVAEILAAIVRRDGLEGEVVTFVPGGRRSWAAGFDHAELLARAVAGALDRPVRRLLVRSHDGPRQSEVGLGQRRANAAGRFAARAASPGSVLLVDDVMTTGATAEACALALLRAGAGTVDVVTWARTLRRARGLGA